MQVNVTKQQELFKSKKERKEPKNINDYENNHKFLYIIICEAESRVTERI